MFVTAVKCHQNDLVSFSIKHKAAGFHITRQTFFSHQQTYLGKTNPSVTSCFLMSHLTTDSDFTSFSYLL